MGTRKILTRRNFVGLALLPCVSAFVPARAQAVHRISWLGFGPSGPPAAFVDRMRELGYEPGRTLLIEHRGADSDPGRLPELARELAALKPALIATGSHQTAIALKQVTSSIPIVFRLGIDPVETGLVASLGRPGGNLTGIFQLTADLFGKRFELLRELAPRAHKVGILRQASEEPYVPMIRDFARRAGFEAVSLIASRSEEIGPAIAAALPQKVEAIMIGGGPLNNQHRQIVVDAVARTRLPAVFPELHFAEAGGLLAYASDLREGFVRLADYAHRILQGAKPADLPVEQSSKFELVVNLKTAKAQGIKIPQTVLLRATKVIE